MQSKAGISILLLLSVSNQSVIQSNPGTNIFLSALRQSRGQITQQMRRLAQQQPRRTSQIKTSTEEITNAVQLGRQLQKGRIKSNIASFMTGLLGGTIWVEESIYKNRHDRSEERYRVVRTKVAQIYKKIFNSEDGKEENSDEATLPLISHQQTGEEKQEAIYSGQSRDEEKQLLAHKRSLSLLFVTRCEKICNRAKQVNNSEVIASRINQTIATCQLEFDTALAAAQSQKELSALQEEYFGTNCKVDKLESDIQQLLELNDD